MTKRIIMLNIILTLFFVFSSFPIISVSCEETFTVSSYATTTVTNAKSLTDSDDLIVLSMDYGVKTLVYLAINISEFPKDVTPTSSEFKINSHAVSEVCYISAFCSSEADWVRENVTWETRPDTGTFVSANFIGTMNEKYSYTSNSLNNAVKEAMKDGGLITISLKTGIDDDNQHGLITFYPDVVLEVSYVANEPLSAKDILSTLDTDEEPSSSSSSRIPMFHLFIMMLSLATIMLVALAFVIKRYRRFHK